MNWPSVKDYDRLTSKGSFLSRILKVSDELDERRRNRCLFIGMLKQDVELIVETLSSSSENDRARFFLVDGPILILPHVHEPDTARDKGRVCIAIDIVIDRVVLQAPRAKCNIREGNQDS